MGNVTAKQSVLLVGKTHDRSCGWGRVGFELGREFADSEGRFTYFETLEGSLCFSPGSGRVDIAERRHETGFVKRQFLRALLKAIYLRMRDDLNFIVCSDETALIKCFFISALVRVPVVNVFHGTYGPRLLTSGKGKWLCRKAVNHAKINYCVSEYTAKKIKAVYPQFARKMQIISLGIDQRWLNESPQPYAVRKNSIVSIGEVKERKGIKTVLYSLAMIPTEVRPIFKVVGAFNSQGAYYKQIDQLVKVLGIEGSVIFTGQIKESELIRILDESVALVMPSRDSAAGFEGLGLVHVEANARGLPTIGSWQSGNSSVIKSGETGFLVDQDDVEGLSRYLYLLLTDHEVWTRMSRSAMENAKSRNWTATVGQIVRGIHGG